MKNDRPKNFKIDKEKCAKCNTCITICWNGNIAKGDEGYPVQVDREIVDEWNMCWECHRCMEGHDYAWYSFFQSNNLP